MLGVRESRKRPFVVADPGGANLTAGDTFATKLRTNPHTTAYHSASSNSRFAYVAKPLVGRSYVLELADRKEYGALANEIQRLGGQIVDAVNSQNGSTRLMLVSDHRHAEKLERVSGEKSIDGRGVANERIPSNLLKTMPILLRQAAQHNIKIKTLTAFKTYLKMVKSRLTTSISATNAPQKLHPRKSLLGNLNDSRMSTTNTLLQKLRVPYIKIEDSSQNYCPIYKEFSSNDNYHTMYVGLEYGNSLFHKASQEQIDRRQREEAAAREIADDPKEIICVVHRRQSTVKQQKHGGYCEICGTKYEEDLRVHYKTREHIARINQPGFYDEVDALLGSYASEITCPDYPVLMRSSGPPGLRNAMPQHSPIPAADAVCGNVTSKYVKAKGVASSATCSAAVSGGTSEGYNTKNLGNEEGDFVWFTDEQLADRGNPNLIFEF